MTLMFLNFDLRSTAEDWFKPGATFIIETSSGDTIDSTHASYDMLEEDGFNFVTQKSLVIQLVGVNIEGDHSYTTAELDFARNELQNYLSAQYPNSIVHIRPTHVSINSPNVNTLTLEILTNILGMVTSIRSLTEGIPTGNNLNPRCSNVFYYGLIDPRTPFGSGVGLGHVSEHTALPRFNCQGKDLSSLGRWDTSNVLRSMNTAAHEIGHNHGLNHVASGTTTPNNINTNYPHADGSIGKEGYDATSHVVLASNDRFYDIMSYRNIRWMSDYHYNRIRNFQALIMPYERRNDPSVQAFESLRSPSPVLSEVSTGQAIQISGMLNEEGTWDVLNLLVFDDVSLSSSSNSKLANYVMKITRLDGQVQYEPFDMSGSIAHTTAKPFKLWVRDLNSPIANIEIHDRRGRLLLYKVIHEVSSRLEYDKNELTYLGRKRWSFRSSYTGEHFLMRKSRDKMHFITNGRGNDAIVFNARMGDILYVYYTKKGIRKTFVLKDL